MENINDLIPELERMSKKLEEVKEQIKKLDERIGSLELQISEICKEKEPEEREPRKEKESKVNPLFNITSLHSTRVLELNESGKTYDVETANHSFRIFSERLKSSGIKNWYFPLQINDPSIVYLDTNYPSYDDQEVAEFIKECSENIWYFIREVMEFNPVSATFDKYDDFDVAMKELFLFTKGINVFIEDDSILCRRMLYEIMIWLLLFKPATLTANIDMGRVKREKEFLSKIQELPKYFMPKNNTIFSNSIVMDGFVSSKGSISQTNYRNQTTLSMFSIFNVDTISIDKAKLLFRGILYNTFSIIDPSRRGELTERILETLAVGRTTMIDRGTSFPIIIIDKPNDDGSLSNFSKNIIKNGVSWDDNFFDMDEESLKKLVGDRFVYIK